MFQFVVPKWCVAIGIESHAELAVCIAAAVFAVAFAALCIHWRNRAREIRCRGEWVESQDIPELRRREHIRNIFALATLVSIGVALWVMYPMCIIVPAVLGGSLLIDMRQVPYAYLPPAKDR